jgi:hypothetical protein
VHHQVQKPGNVGFEGVIFHRGVSGISHGDLFRLVDVIGASDLAKVWRKFKGSDNRAAKISSLFWALMAASGTTRFRRHAAGFVRGLGHSRHPFAAWAGRIGRGTSGA